MKCPIKGCWWEMSRPHIEDTLDEELIRHCSIIAQTAITIEPHEILLRKLKEERQKRA